MLELLRRRQHQVVQSAHSMQPDHRHDQPAEHHHDELQEIRPGHGDQPAVDRVATRQHRQAHDGHRLVQTEHAFHRLAPGEHHHRHLGDDPQHQRTNRKQVAACRVVPPFQELRHRVKSAPDVERQENPDQRREREPVPPLPLRHDKAHRIGDADHPDEVLRADVGRDDGPADRVPGQPVAGEEIAAGVPGFPPRHPEAQRDIRRQIDCKQD